MSRDTSWEALSSELLVRIAEYLPPIEVACALRVINKAAAEAFRSCNVVRLSQAAPHFAFISRWGSPDATRGLTLKQRRQLLALTACSGSLGNLQVAYTAAGCLLEQEVFDAAVAGGSRVVCQWLFDMHSPSGEEASATAAQAGDLGLVRFLLQRQPRGPPDNLVKGAWTGGARGGHRDICEALRADGLPCPPSAACASARGGHVGLTERLLELRELGDDEDSDSDDSDDNDHNDEDLERLLFDAALGFDLPSLQQLFRAQLGDADGHATWFGRHGLGPLDGGARQPHPRLAGQGAVTPGTGRHGAA